MYFSFERNVKSYQLERRPALLHRKKPMACLSTHFFKRSLLRVVLGRITHLWFSNCFKYLKNK
jgi:hypothetical protein